MALEARTRGAPAAITFDPTAVPRAIDTGLVRTADVTLAHELAHAVHITNGGYHYVASTDLGDRYGTNSWEEGYALVIENMYRSETRLRLRRTYLGDQPRLESDPEHPMARVVEDHAVTVFDHDAQHFATELAGLTEAEVPYNPFRARLRSSATSRRRSRRAFPS